ncbi:MAG TPA: DNA internalization-related competence protein ComEC/Rec2 [Candidatus Limnocylindria bacterium]|nr:DNA internalization-related competence protein ComEC/Rec2 [Candidatus Limnocylindria bacterium]
MQRSAWLAIGAVCGALICGASPPPALQLIAVPLVVAMGAGLRRRPAAAALCLGLALILLRSGAGAVVAAPPDKSTDIAGGSHEALVLSIGTPGDGMQRAVLELRPPAASQHIYAWLPRYPAVFAGDVVRVDGRIEPAPTDSDFGAFLARSGIGYTLRSRVLELDGSDGSPMAALEDFRRAVAGLIETALPEPQAGLATAMAIGLRDLVPREVAADFRAAGLSHVVAISGWHITLIGGIAAGLLGALTRRRRSAVVLLVIAAYAILAGASPSILRAAVMAGVVLVARESGRRGGAQAGLSLTVVALLLIEPATIADAGFQLSAVATAGLLAWASRLRDCLASRLPNATPAWLLEALGVSLAAQAATLPLTLIDFERVSLVAPLANLLIAPLVAPSMLLTVIGVLVGTLIGLGVPGLVFAPLILVCALGIGAMVQIAHFCAGLPFATLDVPAPFNYVAAAATAVVMFLVSRRRSTATEPKLEQKPPEPRGPTRRLIGAASSVSLCVLLVVVNGSRPDGRLHVTVLDVGQGDAILLQGPSGGRLLIDAGPDPDRLLMLLDQRIPTWDRRLDTVVLTHPHEDHVGGLALLLTRYRIGTVAETGMPGPGPSDAAYRAELAAQGRSTRVVAAGDEIRLDGARLHVIWPQPDSVPASPPDSGKDINDTSVVIELHFGARDMLLPGDAEEEIDPHLLAAGLAARVGPQLDVLKVAHHGGRTATTGALVEALHPRIAVISVGADNDYGHPAPETLARLESAGSEIYRTDLDGSIDISTDGFDLLAQTEHGRPTPTPSPLPQPVPAALLPLPSPNLQSRRCQFRRATRPRQSLPAWSPSRS